MRLRPSPVWRVSTQPLARPEGNPAPGNHGGDVRSKYPPLLPGASAEHVSKSVALAKANVREEMTGFNVRSNTARPFKSAEGFLRWKLGRAANDAFNKMAPHLKGACVFRVTLTVSSAIRMDRAFHAVGLKSFMKRALREIRPWAVAYCANLHVHRDNYLHVDATVVVRNEDVEAFRRRARILHTLGWRPSLGVRASTCKIMPQGDQETDLQRSLDYTLRYDRHRRRPQWIEEAIRAIGVARSSGFKQSRASKYTKASARTTNSLSGRGNSLRNGCGIAIQQSQGTTKNPNVASPAIRKWARRTPGRPSKHLHPAYSRGFRRDREAREFDRANSSLRHRRARLAPPRAIALDLMSSTALVFLTWPLIPGATVAAPAEGGRGPMVGPLKGTSRRCQSFETSPVAEKLLVARRCLIQGSGARFGLRLALAISAFSDWQCANPSYCGSERQWARRAKRMLLGMQTQTGSGNDANHNAGSELRGLKSQGRRCPLGSSNSRLGIPEFTREGSRKCCITLR